MCVCVCVCVRACACVCVCVCAHCAPAATAVSLSKELYSHCYCSSPPSCINGNLAIGSKCQAVHVSLNGVGPRVSTPSSMRHVHPPVGHHSHPQEDLSCTDSGVPALCTGIPACLGRCDRVNGSYRVCFFCACVYVCIGVAAGPADRLQPDQ